MGALCCCLSYRDSETNDPIMDAEARARAAEAAQRRQEQFENSAAGRAAKRQVERERQQA